MTAAAHAALPSWSRRLISELEANDRRAERLANVLTPEQLNWRPRPDAWSVGQCLHHLQSNRAARELVYASSNYDVNRIRFKNPFIPVLRFTVGTGLEIVAKHQSCHLLQAEAVRQSAEFPA